jgi:hypothetical protein
VGRLFLTGRRGTFEAADVEFLPQLVLQVAPMLDNIRLLERLASSAAEHERQRLARDIHDSVVQPYLGLQYRLAALRNKLASGAADVSGDVERLFESTAEEVNGLRGFVRGLKDADGRRDDLAAAVRRFAAQFGDDYDIDVRVEFDGRLNVNDRLAAEVIRFVHEGLSNVRKHTRATRATLRLMAFGLAPRSLLQALRLFRDCVRVGCRIFRTPFSFQSEQRALLLMRKRGPVFPAASPFAFIRHALGFPAFRDRSKFSTFVRRLLPGAYRIGGKRHRRQRRLRCAARDVGVGDVALRLAFVDRHGRQGHRHQKGQQYSIAHGTSRLLVTGPSPDSSGAADRARP